MRALTGGGGGIISPTQNPSSGTHKKGVSSDSASYEDRFYWTLVPSKRGLIFGDLVTLCCWGGVLGLLLSGTL